MLPRVNDLFKLRTPDSLPDTPLSKLESIFDVATNNITATIPGHFFRHIYMPLELYDPTTETKLKTWSDIGLTLYDLSEAYWSQYSRGLLDAPYYLCADGTEQTKMLLELARKAKSVLTKNKYKYLKLIESLGLEYNPLFNVDGVEIRQRLENEGVNDVSETNGNTQTFNNLTDTHNVAPYDSAVTKEEYNDTRTGNISDSGSRDTTYTHKNAKNMVGTLVQSDADDDVKQYQVNEDSAEYYVERDDTAFGYRLIGGDKMEVEKLIRQGNIGIVSSQKLVQEQRDIALFSVIEEYFNDLNKIILVGNWS
jgi:hypothetical protein